MGNQTTACFRRGAGLTCTSQRWQVVFAGDHPLPFFAAAGRTRHAITGRRRSPADAARGVLLRAAVASAQQSTLPSPPTVGGACCRASCCCCWSWRPLLEQQLTPKAPHQQRQTLVATSRQHRYETPTGLRAQHRRKPSSALLRSEGGYKAQTRSGPASAWMDPQGAPELLGRVGHAPAAQEVVGLPKPRPACAADAKTKRAVQQALAHRSDN